MIAAKSATGIAAHFTCVQNECYLSVLAFFRIPYARGPPASFSLRFQDKKEYGYEKNQSQGLLSAL